MIKAETSPEIELIYSPIVNYAIQQNRVPVVRSLVIQNNQNEELSNIEIEIFSEPEFANSWKYQIDFIPKNQSLRVDVRKFKIFGKFLSELTEKRKGKFY